MGNYRHVNFMHNGISDKYNVCTAISIFDADVNHIYFWRRKCNTVEWKLDCKDGFDAMKER